MTAALPRTGDVITTLEAYDLLPAQTILRNSEGTAFEVAEDRGLHGTNGSYLKHRDYIAGHLRDWRPTVIYLPGQPPIYDPELGDLDGATSLSEALFDIADKYGAKVTNNEPRWKDGVWLHHVGDFIDDVMAQVRRFGYYQLTEASEDDIAYPTITRMAQRFTGGTPVDDLTIELMKTWGRVDPKTSVAQFPTSHVATFADMARAAIAWFDAREGAGDIRGLLAR